MIVGRNIEEVFLSKINKICCYFSDYKSQSNNNTTDPHLFIQFKKSSDLLFKFLAYLYSFLNKLINNKAVNISIHIDSIQKQILHLFMAPLTMNLNSDTQSHPDNTYLCFIATDKFKYKQMLIKQCLANLQVFIKKFDVDLFDHVSTDQVVYILRNLSVDLAVKNSLMTILVECLVLPNNTDTFDNLKELFTVLLESLHLKVNDSFNENLFKIIAVYMTKEAENSSLENNSTSKIIEKTLANLHSASANTEKPLCFCEQFEILLKFLTDLLKRSHMNIGAVNKLLSHNEYHILKISFDYVICNEMTSNIPNSEILAEVQDTTYQFYQVLFDSLRHAKLTNKVK